MVLSTKGKRCAWVYTAVKPKTLGTKISLLPQHPFVYISAQKMKFQN